MIEVNHRSGCKCYLCRTQEVIFEEVVKEKKRIIKIIEDYRDESEPQGLTGGEVIKAILEAINNETN